MKYITNPLKLMLLPVLLVVAACETTEVADQCLVQPRGSVAAAMSEIEGKLSSGCEYHFDDYFDGLMSLAVNNPDRRNREHFSAFLVNVSDSGVISKRQASDLYNRYFNVKFVSLAGEYNTCSQVCPTRKKVLRDMSLELEDKELGLVKVSNDATSYYRADLLLKESEMVLLATCRACEAGAQ